MKRKGKIHIGTSGWHYKHWKGPFYPGDLPDSGQMAYYAVRLHTVELNNSFYMLPPRATFEKWRKASPRDFLFAVKASRFITHNKKLKDAPETTVRFFENITGLGRKLGPVLFQLPPSWKVNPGRLSDFVSHLPSAFRYAFEFRNPTWYTEEIYAILRGSGCAFCIYELGFHRSPEIVTAGHVYVRLHGPGEKYQGSYTDRSLKAWAKKCLDWAQSGSDVFVYFDNDQAGYAAFNALKLKELTG